MEKTIEERTAEVLLQKPRVVTIGDKTYVVQPPTLATLIRVSEVISRLPAIRLDKDRIVEDSLAVAKDTHGIGLIAAILILGARKADERFVNYKRRCRGWLRPKKIISERTRAETLGDEIENSLSPSAIKDLMAELLGHLQLADFFGLTTFLTEINLTRPTKVESETTQRGR